MAGTYTYEPAMITSYGKDRMRFELGDVMVDGKERTCALSDEEYIVLCDDVQSAKDWKRAKLKCLESIFRRFSFEPDTTVGPTSFKFGDRAKLWQEEYEERPETCFCIPIGYSDECRRYKQTASAIFLQRNDEP